MSSFAPSIQRRRFLHGAATAAVASASWLRTRPAAAVGNFRVFKYENGLHAILLPDQRYPRVTIAVRHMAGVRNELPGKSGVAHLLEHVTFRPPRPPTRWAVNEFAYNSHGSNASTHLEHTQYYRSVPSFKLKDALWRERWRITEAPRKWGASDMNLERPIVLNELRWRGELRPHARARVLAWQNLYPSDHPFFHGYLGSAEEIQSLTFKDLDAFHQANYASTTTYVAIVGDFDPALGEELAESLFGGIPTSQPAPARPLPTFAVSAEKRVEVTDALAEQPRLQMCWHTPKWYSEGDAQAELCAEILANMSGSRLVTDVPEALSAWAQQLGMASGSRFDLTVAPRSGVPLEALEARVEAALDRLREEPPSAREMDRATRALMKRDMHRMESALARANTLIDTMANFGDADPMKLADSRYRSVQAEQIQAFVQSTLAADKRVTVLSRPKGMPKGASGLSPTNSPANRQGRRKTQKKPKATRTRSTRRGS